MTNTTQTEPLSLLDGVEPDSFRDITSMNAKCNHGVAYICGNCTVKRVYFYSRKTVEALLEANRKQVLLAAATLADQWGDARNPDNGGHALRNYATELRRMALEPTGVDKGEKE
jgi:hypothetical protein